MPDSFTAALEKKKLCEIQTGLEKLPYAVLDRPDMVDGVRRPEL